MGRHKRETIGRFDGPYAFLSNFHPCRVTFNGMTFSSVEAAFQAAKCADRCEQAQFQSLSPGEAKRLGQRVQLRPKWEERKVTVMTYLLLHKFRDNPELAQKLLDTGDAVLVEGNTWHDNYWGSCTCPGCAGKRGKNTLGKLLMRVRDSIASPPNSRPAA